MFKDSKFAAFLRAIVTNDIATVRDKLIENPSLSKEVIEVGATRENPKEFFVEELRHYIYAGDTALHVAAMAHRADMVELLVKNGADVRARNRRGAEPLHYAADSGPNLKSWDIERQFATVEKLTQLGADPNTLDKSGVAPLHRAVRNRCAGAVKALIKYGANVNLKNKSGSTPFSLAGQTTGKSGSGTDEVKREQSAIIKMLKSAGAK
jgi:hypothetical protein